MNVDEVLDHPMFKAADPIVRAGFEFVGSRGVRWVHSSEVLDIGPLLRGGELLLSGGEALALAPKGKQKQYIFDLSARRVAALAIETGGELDEIPACVIEAANTAGVILIELREVVPFVVIAESINSTFVSSSVTMLQKADEVSHEVAVELAAGADLREILEMIASELSARVSLLVPGAYSQDLVGISSSSVSGEAAADTVEVEIPLRGIVAAALQIEFADQDQEAYVRTVGERVADVLGLALLQQRPPSLSDIAGVQLIRAVAAGEPRNALLDLCGAVGIDPEVPLMMLSARSVDSSRLRGVLENALAGMVRRSVFYATPGELVGLAVFAEGGERQKRSSLVKRLQQDIDAGDGSLSVGPLVLGVASGYFSFMQAQLALQLAQADSTRSGVVDSSELIVDRMIAENLELEARARLTAELLGELIDYDARRGTALLSTLEIWLQSGCNTASSARAMFLERQSMHNRLQKIFALIGGDPRGTRKVGGLLVALRALRQVPGMQHPN